ncbi:hypothetical protein Cgig2_005509 [Carnegiea gigantea]|uniref:Reverse transcriptase domain-containing protein n=1 Tax=Carnegiea gigantea TaxID=171969 RepID=A0A9Q1GHV5_9CARY|nr:hypothetical protein Cgig2_005509 [Carnegiea gigantea]
MDLLEQQSKLEWIKYGDDCTKLFFAKAKQRKLATYIYMIKEEDDRQVEGFDQVGKVMLSFYKNLLRKQFTPRSSIDLEVIKAGPVLSIEHQQALIVEFSTLDIKEALFSIPNTKSPGPNGFNSGFYKSLWDSSGPLLTAVVKEFFKTGMIPIFLSATKLIVIPKTSSPQTAADFRRSSCYNVAYKCISKLLCSKLKDILSGIISHSQSAFIKQRELLHNIHDLPRHNEGLS